MISLGNSAKALLNDAHILAKYVRGLRSYLRNPLGIEEALALYDLQFEQRESSFLHVLRHAVFDNSRSPYRKLLEWAGATFGDIEAMVRRDGVESTLSALHTAGVSVSLEEFKARRNIQRNGLEVSVQASDFDNPLLDVQWRSQTSGSRGRARVLSFALAHLTDDAPTHALFLKSFGLGEHPMMLWRPVPPGAAGIRRALIHAKFGKTPDRWFSQSATRWPAAPASSVFLAWVTVWGCRAWGSGFPRPEHVPLHGARRVAQWIAERKLTGVALHVNTNPGSAVRVCEAALETGLDIAGTFFALGGEAYTNATNSVIKRVGASAASLYSMAEIGQIGFGCSEANEVDDIHLMRNKVAVIQAGMDLADSVSAPLLVSSLRASVPKIMLNVESGDAGIVENRSCGCAASRAGLEWHVHTVRSYEKLTSEGMHFLGDDLLRLVQEVLPGVFGGNAADYQLWECRQNARSRVAIVVSPRRGKIDERLVVETMLTFLSSHSPADKMMAAHWRQGETIKVLRREPVATSSAKVHSLHVVSDLEATLSGH